MSDLAPFPHAVAAPTPWWRHPLAIVLCGGTIMGLSLGARYVQGLFQLPIVADRGWTRETFAFALAIQNLAWGVAQPFTGMVADRFGAARVIAAGLVLYALGLAGMTWASSPAAFVWTAGVCIGVALSCTAFGAVYGALIAGLFGRRWLSLMRDRAQNAPAAPLVAFEGTSAPAAGPDEI